MDFFYIKKEISENYFHFFLHKQIFDRLRVDLRWLKRPSHFLKNLFSGARHRDANAEKYLSAGE